MIQKKQDLNFFSLMMIVISLVIGMGIFKTPAVIAAKSGTPTIFFLVWILGGFIALCGALTYAEIGIRLPVTGAYYKVFAYCYHPAVGFTINVLILISNAASLAVVALIGADYASDLLFGRPSGQIFNITFAIVAVSLFYLVNLFGLKTSSRTQNMLTVLKIGLVLLLISSVFTGLSAVPHGYDTQATVYTYNGHNAALLVMLSLVAVSFTYGGYQQTINFGGEIKSGKTMQSGIITGILVVLFLYLAISYAYVKVIGFDQMKNATAIGALLCETWFGKAGGKVFDAAMFISVLAYVNVLLMSNPRVMFAMSEDRVLPKIFSYRHPATGVLIPGLSLFALITVLIVFNAKGIDDVMSFSIFLDCFGMSLSAATLLILRKRKHGEASVTSPLKKITPVLCVLFVIAYGFVMTAVIIDNPKSALTGIALLLIFAAVYFVFYHKKHSKKIA